MFYKEWIKPQSGERLSEQELNQILDNIHLQMQPIEESVSRIPDEDVLLEIARRAEVELNSQYTFIKIFPWDTAAEALKFRCAEWLMRLACHDS